MSTHSSDELQYLHAVDYYIAVRMVTYTSQTQHQHSATWETETQSQGHPVSTHATSLSESKGNNGVIVKTPECFFVGDRRKEEGYIGDLNLL